jgi:hypothetical protein
LELTEAVLERAKEITILTSGSPRRRLLPQLP